MPWTAKQADEHKKCNSDKERRIWASVANSVLKQTGDEGKAIRAANGAVNKYRAKNRTSDMSIPNLFALPMGKAESGNFERVELGKYRKELIRVGKWRHPLTGMLIDVTPERMQGWVKTFGAMQADGVKVPFPDGHRGKSRDNIGFVERLDVEGNSLYGTINVPLAADCEKIGTTIKDVSVAVHRSVRGTTGNDDSKDYGEGIVHVAATPYPVVPNQEDFKIAASKEDEEDIIQFAADKVLDRSAQVAQKSNGTLKGGQSMFDLSKVIEALSLEGDITEENWLDAVGAVIDDLNAKIEAGSDSAKELERAQTDLKAAQAELARYSKDEAARKAAEDKDDELANHPKVLELQARIDAQDAEAVARRVQLATSAITDLKKSGRIGDELEKVLSDRIPTEFDKDNYDEQALSILEGQIDVLKAMPENASLPIGANADVAALIVQKQQNKSSTELAREQDEEADAEADAKLKREGFKSIGDKEDN